ncbi:MAG: hypothetical protein ABJA67_17215, partial [Chthonomonadales bacterium]
MQNYHPSAATILTELRTAYPDSPFLALGQTIWWDEPMKAVLLLALESHGLGGSMVGGVHDTDYFAKLQVRRTGQSRFEMMAHNDGDTRDLWSAAGEISSLFGSETFPRKQDLNKYHVPIGRLARAEGKDRIEYISQSTEAYGWRGLVYTGGRDLIVNSLQLKEVGESIVTTGLDRIYPKG